MAKLNIGCGSKYHRDWINIDLNSNSDDVISHNILKGLPFRNNYFDVVYHSHVLEHLPKEKVTDFIKECYRVLKPEGIIRIIVPDLERIVNEYRKNLNEILSNPNTMNEANYDWILLEMYDQSVRNYSGGQMAEFLTQPELINKHYIVERIGDAFNTIREHGFKKKQNSNVTLKNKSLYIQNKIKKLLTLSAIRSKFIKLLMTNEERTFFRVGQFRFGGEIHYWMYDCFSLKRLLEKCGFKHVERKLHFESNIADWDNNNLDVQNGTASLIMEAKKLH